MQKQASSLWFGIVLGALLMFFIINFLSNNFFSTTMMSQNSCAVMHGSPSYFHHIGFLITFLTLVVLAIFAFQLFNKK
jgi:hypothetical protein